MKTFLAIPLLLCALTLVPAKATAAPFTFDNGAGLSASATFSIDGAGNLVLSLKNTAVGDVWDPASVLTGVFFDIGSSPTLTLTPKTAVICATCFVTNGGLTDAGGGVNGEWAYKQGTDLAYGGDYGISSAGLGIFGSGNLFPGGTSYAPPAPGGVAYGITATGDDPNTNGGLKGVPLISNEVIFTLSGVPKGFDLGSINNLTFQYGTALNEVQTPEPATLLLFIPAGAAAWVARRRRARA